MSENMAVEFEGVGKMYRLYKSRMDSFLDITSLGRVAPWWNPKIENFLGAAKRELQAQSGLAARHHRTKWRRKDHAAEAHDRQYPADRRPDPGSGRGAGACWKPAPAFTPSSRVTRTSRLRSFRTASIAAQIKAADRGDRRVYRAG